MLAAIIILFVGLVIMSVLCSWQKKAIAEIREYANNLKLSRRKDGSVDEEAWASAKLEVECWQRKTWML